MKFLIFLLLLFQNPKPEVRIPDLEKRVHDLIDSERQSSERGELQWDDALANLARAHSEDMVKRGYFKHIDPEGRTPMKRLGAAGRTDCRLVGENIYQNNLYSRVITEKYKTTYDWNSAEKIAETTVKGWMDSSGHRESILDKNYNREGIGVAIAPDDKVYITQILCADAGS